MSSSSKLVGILSIGSVFVEWAEFSIYMFMSTIISGIFFPKQDNNFAFILTMMIFAASYLARPMGSLIYGYVGDIRGRRQVMLLSVVLMSVATFSIGLLPTYEQAGMLAPMLLLICRLVQGFAIGIEFNNASVYLIEHSRRHPIVASAFVACAASLGMSSGAMVVSILNFELYENIWRLPFLLFGSISFVIYILRQNLKETPAFLEMREQNNLSDNPLREVFALHKTSLLLIALTAAFLGTFFYAGHVYLITFMVNYGSYDLEQATRYSSITEMIITLFTPLIAYIGVRLGISRKIFLLGIAGLSFNAPFLFAFASLGPEMSHLMVASFMVYAIADAMFGSYVYYFLSELLPAQVRCTGTGLAYSSAVAIFGGTAPLVSEQLVQHGLILAPGFYVTIAGLCLVTSIMMTRVFVKNSKFINV